MINKKAREDIVKISEKLSAISKDYSYPEQYKKESDRLLSNSGITWSVYSNNRIVCGLSRTLNGNNITENYQSCIVKFEPRANDWIPNKYNNQCEIDVWEKAIKTNDESLFADIIDYDETGKWVLMKEYIPVFTSQIDKVRNYNLKDKIPDYIIIEENNFINQFKNKMKNTRWKAYDLKGGNIGYDPDNDSYILIDYGSSIKYE